MYLCTHTQQILQLEHWLVITYQGKLLDVITYVCTDIRLNVFLKENSMFCLWGCKIGWIIININDWILQNMFPGGWSVISMPVYPIQVLWFQLFSFQWIFHVWCFKSYWELCNAMLSNNIALLLFPYLLHTWFCLFILKRSTSTWCSVLKDIKWCFCMQEYLLDVFPCTQNICCISHVLGVYLLYFTKSKSDAYFTYVYILSGFERAKFKHNRKLTVSPLNIHTISLCSIFVTYTVQCHYNVVNHLTNIHKRRPIARPLGQGMGRLL